MHANCAMHIIRSSGPNLSNSRFCHVLVKQLFVISLPSMVTSRELQRWKEPTFQPTLSIQLPCTEPIAKGDKNSHMQISRYRYNL